LTEKKKRLIIDWKKWVFTVHLVAACLFLFLLPEIGKNNPKAEQIQTDNEIRMKWNREIDRAIVSNVPEEEIRQIKQEYMDYMGRVVCYTYSCTKI
jgi:single-stranded DNA-specific DHH superfamily exonuclease